MKKFIQEIIQFQNLRISHWIAIFSIYFILHVPLIIKDKGDTNLAFFQAKAFLDNRIDIDKYYWDAAVYEGKYYVSFPPFPSIVILPFAAIFSTVKTTLISVFLTFISMYVFYRILEKLMPAAAGRKWIFVAYFFGTGYWYALLTSHHVNGFAHVLSTCLILLLLLELFEKQRPVLLGLILAATFLTRQMTVFYGALIIYLIFLHQDNKKVAFSKVIITGFVFMIPALTFLYFNFVRFDDWFETGYKYIYSPFHGETILKKRVVEHGLFDLSYFWINFYHTFIKGHNIIFGGEGLLKPVSMDMFGTSILAASPFIVAAFKPKAKKELIVSFWVTLVLITIPLLTYHNSGWQQVNTQRFTLDFFPLLMILTAWGYPSIPEWLFRLLVLYAIALNCLSLALHLYLN